MVRVRCSVEYGEIGGERRQPAGLRERVKVNGGELKKVLIGSTQ